MYKKVVSLETRYYPPTNGSLSPLQHKYCFELHACAAMHSFFFLCENNSRGILCLPGLRSYSKNIKFIIIVPFKGVFF